MIYGQLQYYSDELHQWLQNVKSRNEELQESLRQVNVILAFPVVSLLDLKAGNALIDQLMAQRQELDHIFNHISRQAHCLKKAIVAADGLGASVFQQQKNLRIKMQNNEFNFVTTKYDCSNFLSSFFEPDSLPLRA